MQRTSTYSTIHAAALLGLSFHPSGPVFSGPARQVAPRPAPHTFLGAVWGHAVAQAEGSERIRVECPYSLGSIGWGRQPQPGDRVVTKVDHHNRRREECACSKCDGTGRAA